LICSRSFVRVRLRSFLRCCSAFPVMRCGVPVSFPFVFVRPLHAFAVLVAVSFPVAVCLLFAFTFSRSVVLRYRFRSRSFAFALLAALRLVYVRLRSYVRYVHALFFARLRLFTTSLRVCVLFRLFTFMRCVPLFVFACLVCCSFVRFRSFRSLLRLRLLPLSFAFVWRCFVHVCLRSFAFYVSRLLVLRCSLFPFTFVLGFARYRCSRYFTCVVCSFTFTTFVPVRLPRFVVYVCCSRLFRLVRLFTFFVSFPVSFAFTVSFVASLIFVRCVSVAFRCSGLFRCSRLRFAFVAFRVYVYVCLRCHVTFRLRLWYVRLPFTVRAFSFTFPLRSLRFTLLHVCTRFVSRLLRSFRVAVSCRVCHVPGFRLFTFVWFVFFTRFRVSFIRSVWVDYWFCPRFRSTTSVWLPFVVIFSHVTWFAGCVFRLRFAVSVCPLPVLFGCVWFRFRCRLFRCSRSVRFRSDLVWIPRVWFSRFCLTRCVAVCTFRRLFRTFTYVYRFRSARVCVCCVCSALCLRWYVRWFATFTFVHVLRCV